MGDRGDESLYGHLYRCVRDDIEAGVIAAHQKLPSKRNLAKNLGVSLITVEGAYSQLVAEGYVYALPRKGYYACEIDHTNIPGHMTYCSPHHVAGSKPGGTTKTSHAAERTAGSGVGAARAFEKGQDSVGNRMAGSGAAVGRTLGRGQDGSIHRMAGGGVVAWHTLGGERGSEAFSAAGCSCGSRFSPDRAISDIIADFSGQTAPRGLFPYNTWAKTVREVLTCESEDTLAAETQNAGSPRLREQLARYLHDFRGMRVHPEQIVVGAGAQLLYNLIVQLLGRACGYAVEDPGYPRLTRIYQANDVALAHIPLDANGVRVDMLRASGAGVVHIMPSHQFPTGQVTSVSRRYELLGWASEAADRYIVEDDYDCEFRLSGRPIPALQSIDASECVIYTNTFAKSLGPAFRMGYMVLPSHLASLFAEKLGFYSSTVSTIEQLALARFMEKGDYERHVNRSRVYYRTVRNELVDALRSCAAANLMEVEATDAGLHFLLGVRTAAPGRALVAEARKRGVVLVPLADFYHNRHGEGSVAERVMPGSGVEPSVGGDTPCAWFVMSYSSLARESVGPAVVALAEAVLAVCA